MLALVSDRRRRGLAPGGWGEELRAGGVDLQVLAVYADDLREALLMIDALHEELARPGELALCLDGRDVEVASERLRVVLALEGAAPLGPDLGVLRVLHRLGLRMLSLTWNHRNAFADGCLEERPRGLSALGREAVAEAEALGIVVDVAHLAEPGFWDVAAMTRRGLLASHTGCRAVYDHPRNLSDAQLAAVGRSGGIVGIALHPLLLGGEPSIERAVAHVLHAVEVAGARHVALGADFCAPLAEVMPAAAPALFATLEGLAGPGALPRLREALLGGGLREDDVAAVLGGSLTRFLAAEVGRPPRG